VWKLPPPLIDPKDINTKRGQWIFGGAAIGGNRWSAEFGLGGGAFLGGKRSCYRQQILTSKAEAETIVQKKVMDFVAIVMIFMVLLGME
jgi:hypothetical protein